jgi:GxxExxY protein
MAFFRKQFAEGARNWIMLRLLWSKSTCIYKGRSVDDYFVDTLVEDVSVIEIKCVERLANEHTAQCINYLRASGMWKRIVWNFCAICVYLRLARYLLRPA